MSHSAQTNNEDTAAKIDEAHRPRHVKVGDSTKRGKRPTVILLSVVLAVLIVGVGIGISYLVWQQYQLDRAVWEAKEIPLSVSDDATGSALGTGPVLETEPLAENPIDFTALKAENPDIYAWIHIPGTAVDHPVLQRPNDDNYYLTHNRDNQVSVEGALYSQSVNSTDLSDPVTVIYGHNMVNNGMFATLHYFEDPDFFDANDTFYLYTPTHILTYRIISAYIYDDRHIMNSFDFSDPQTLRDYFAFVETPDALIANARADRELSPDDKIVQLSTCMSDPAYSNSRYLVNGVLVDDQPTR